MTSGPADPVRVLSCGGGLDSFAMLLVALAAGERLDAVCFVDVTDPAQLDPGEWPGTYRHLREVVAPLCAAHGVEFVHLDTTRYPVRDARSLHAWLAARAQIPVAGPDRICTRVAKVERFERWLADRWPDRDVEVWIGFEAGEESRADKDPNAGTRGPPKPGAARRRNRFPLMEWGLCRCRCESLVRASGHPVPRKSACVFCPYASKGDWQALARELPARFAQAVQLEADKPPTKANGIKLSIMGFRTLYDRAGVKTGNKAPPLPEFIRGDYKPARKGCAVCGAPRRASKATGCGYLEES